ncbi:unnamed protein product, partial [Rotaria socialis]
RYLQFINTASQRTNVPSNLIAAVIWKESRGDPNAATINPVNQQFDGGLMQINAITFNDQIQQHQDIPKLPVTDPETNILAGAYYLAVLFNQFQVWQ